MELERFFARAIRASFADLSVHDELAAEYIVDLLARFARTEALFVAGVTSSRLDTVVDLLLEAQASWLDVERFHPEREVTVRRHIGDYTLFMTGVFPERVQRVASTGYYVAQGKRAYRFVSEHDRTSSRPVRRGGGPLFRRLADRFEGFVSALDYARRVHFADAPSHPFFRLA